MAKDVYGQGCSWPRKYVAFLGRDVHDQVDCCQEVCDYNACDQDVCGCK